MLHQPPALARPAPGTRPARDAHAGRLGPAHARRRPWVRCLAGGSTQDAAGAVSSPPHQQQPAAQQPPRPAPFLPVLGHAPAMTQHLLSGGTFEGLLLSWRRQYGPFFEFQVPGSPPVVIVTEPSSIKEVYEVLRYHKSPRYRDLRPVLGEQSMVTSEGEAWASQREAFNPGFSSTFLKAALPGFVECTRHLVARLDQAVAAEEVVLMHHLAVLCTLEVICKVGFGEDVDFLSAGRAGPLWAAFEGLGRHVSWFVDNVPLNWMKHLPWNVSKRLRLQQQLDAQLSAILLKRLADMGIEVDEQQRRALLDGTIALDTGDDDAAAAKCPVPGISGSSSSLHSASPASSSSSGGGSAASGECPFHASPAAAAAAAAAAATGSAASAGSRSASPTADSASDAASSAAAEQLMAAAGGSTNILTLAVELCRRQGDLGSRDSLVSLLSQMKTFFAAGHDTTANLVAWALYYLQCHPAAEARLTDEVLRIMVGSLEPSYGQLREMRYLNAVLKETLRVRPPVGVLARWAPEGTTLSGFDTSNKVVLVSPFLQHMDEAAWGPDAAEWRPDRWLEEEGGTAGGVSRYHYLPFSRGPRDCIGARFALLEAKTILSMLYRSFTFEYAGNGPEQVMMSITAHPKHGVPLRVRRRQAAAAGGRRAAAEAAAATA